MLLVTHDLNEARLLADRLVVIDAGQVLQEGSPSDIHNAPRNARVADLVGIHNRFHGQWLGPADQPGWGRLRWTPEAGAEDHAPVLTVRDKGKLPLNQVVTWVIPGDAITLLSRPAQGEDEFDAEVCEARHLGEITLATLALAAVAGAQMRVTLSGPQRKLLSLGARLGIHLDRYRIHVMPLRAVQRRKP